ncbi:hypothetical protein RJ639_037273 [Escallonia herrerae]|uniref:Upstream activation factor subunit UAF30 n=1 Tax=Escallonia herrerae TaxID=1293975 RepID=A0AA89B8Q2_9ASTE|nr:hypothetical protein RJ639_037273 [Escallonia herrerae]
MASDQEIVEALHSLLRESNPNTTFTSLNDVVQQLGSKLGLDLTHRADFIRLQIHSFLRPQPQQPPLRRHQHPPIDPSVLQPNPNFRPATSQQPPNFLQYSSEFGVPAVQLPPVTKSEGFGTDVAAAAAAAVPEPEAPKESSKTKKRKRGGPGGLNKLCGVSPELQAIVGQPTMPRTEIVRQLWIYIRKNNLQDPSNKRKIVCNDELRLVFETDCTDMFKMNKLLAKHIIPLEPTKPTRRNSKKSKVDVESASETTESVPIVVISEALASVFDTDEREMSQAEVLRRVWEYIKVNQLEDPANSILIHCDAKLQELFRCQSISAMDIPETLAHHHLFRRS